MFEYGMGASGIEAFIFFAVVFLFYVIGWVFFGNTIKSPPTPMQKLINEITHKGSGPPPDGR